MESPRWQRLNRLDKQSMEVAKDFLKFSSYLIKLKNVIDSTIMEMDRDHQFNLFDYGTMTTRQPQNKLQS